MIAAINWQADLAIYLNGDEIERIGIWVVEGVLIRRNNPKRQGKIHVSVNDKRKDENGFGIGVDDRVYWGPEDFELYVFVGNEYYKMLRERGRAGSRTRMIDGAQVDLYSRAGSIEDSAAKELEEMVGT